jgi:hypothetical protein
VNSEVLLLQQQLELVVVVGPTSRIACNEINLSTFSRKSVPKVNSSNFQNTIVKSGGLTYIPGYNFKGSLGEKTLLNYRFLSIMLIILNLRIPYFFHIIE